MRRTFQSLLVVLGAAAVLAGCRGGESEQPPVHLIQNMDTQHKGKAYRRDPSGLFADGRLMRPPVEGTVAQGHLDEDVGLHEGLGDDGQPSLKFPASLERNDAFLARGRSRYDIYCTPCHGVAGDGKGPVASKGLLVPPPSFHDPRLKTMPVGKLYAAIRNGVNNHNMPSYASQIPVVDRWATVAYVRKLQRDQDPTVAEEGGQNIVVAAATTASAEHGSQLYQAKTCVACHTLDGTPRVGPSFKGLFGSKRATSKGEVTADDAYLSESIRNPMASIVNGFPPAMPPLPLSDIEVQSLILFIKAQQ